MQLIYVTGYDRKGMLYWGEISEAEWTEYAGARAEAVPRDRAPSWNGEPYVCPAVLGQGGMGKTKEGDNKTPLGCFAVKAAYGILPDPGCHITYTRITPELYWCGDSGSMYYNRPVYCPCAMPSSYGERLADYVPEYHYLVDIGYNEACEAGRGSGIFLHCCGEKDYTHGCIAVEEQYMVSILCWLRPGAYMVIRRNHKCTIN